MSFSLSKGRFPKRPDETRFLAICREDFRNFKERDGNVLLEYLSTLIKDLEKGGMDPNIYKKQKENLEEVKTLIAKGQEKVAFNLFSRVFPYCMPHRSALKFK